MKLNKLIIICVSIGVFVIAAGIITAQVLKQNSIEKQTQMKIDQENKLITQENTRKSYNRIMINACIEDAETSYWSFMELNGTKQTDGSINAAGRFWDQAKENKKDDIDLCYKKYN